MGPRADVDLRAWGIETGYRDGLGTWREIPGSTLDLLVDVLGAEPGRPPAPGPMRFVGLGEEAPVDGPALLVTEDGGEVRVEDRLPPDLPCGYHRLERLGGGDPAQLVVTPRRCPLPPAPTWGWAAQLYALRSSASWGMGDLADLAELARWSRTDLGAGFVLVNPLHAAPPGRPQRASPYSPSSRRFRNPLYLRIEEVPGAEALGGRLEELADVGRRLNTDRRVDRDAVHEAKSAALEELWDRFLRGPRSEPFESWCRRQGDALDAYATFCTLAEHHDTGWRRWPAEHRHPDSPAVARFAEERAERVGFHRWCQWLIDVQLEAASEQLPVVTDLAVGVDPEGADAWMWQESFASGMSVGAPPDEFNTRGQDWGLPPFDPWKLRSAGYGPFVETVRAGLAHAGGLRFDHVMGLFRMFWVPVGTSPRHGGYVRYPYGDLLDLLALEAARAGAFVVGEDLGTVEEETRRELSRRNVLSYRLLWFEQEHPSRWPVDALSAVTTHDLPTVAGLWTGSDLQAQRSAGQDPNEESTDAVRERLAHLTRLDGDAPVDEVAVRAYAALAEAPSRLLSATLDDAAGSEERPNMPGTVDEWPNWSIGLPLTLEELEAHPRPRRIAAALRRDGREPT